VKRRPVLLAAAVALAAPLSATHADGDASLHAEGGAGVDTNPGRSIGGAGPADGFAIALLRARGVAGGGGLRLAATLDEAVRLYRREAQASAIASRLDTAARLPLGAGLVAGADLSARDLTERGHGLDQDALHGEGSLAWTGGAWGAALSGGWTLFAPREATLRPFLASGPEAALRLSWAPSADDVLSAGYGVAWASFPRWDAVASGGRDDRTQTASVEWARTSDDFIVSVGYAYAWNRSSADGGNFDRHRVAARGAATLPLDVTVALRIALQWSSYPRPLFLPQQLLLAEGQESQDALELRLTRPLGRAAELALAIAHYRAEAVSGGGSALDYRRTLVSATVTWRGEWRRDHGAASFTMGTP